MCHGCKPLSDADAEVDQRIAQALFSDGTGWSFSSAMYGKARELQRVVRGGGADRESLRFRPYELRALLSMLMGAWAYKTAKSRFSVANERSSTALEFRAPIPADRST